MGLQEAIAKVQTYMAALSGIRAAPAFPPEKLDPFPFSVAYAGGGVWEPGPAGVKTGLHIIVVEVHVARGDLSHAVEKAMSFSDSVPNLLFSKLYNDNKWGGTLDTFQKITYTFGPMKWNDVQTIGFRFKVEGIKMQTAVT
jgi:hypothetical protein